MGHGIVRRISSGPGADPIEREILRRCAPSALLAGHFSALSLEGRKRKFFFPEAGLHNLPHFQMMKGAILEARRQVRIGASGGRTTLVFGAKECNDVPLDALAGDGEVYLVDVDAASLRAALETLGDPSCRKRVHGVVMDASLFATELLGRTQDLLEREREDIAAGFRSVVNMHGRACESGRSVFLGKRLPVREASADLVVSSMTVSQFMVGYLQVLVNLFLGTYGREQARRHFLADPPSGSRKPQEPARIAELHGSALPLMRGAAESHVRELLRIVKKEGAVVLSDHALRGRCAFVTETGVEVMSDTLLPYSGNPGEEKSLRLEENPELELPAVFRVDITRPCETFTVSGPDGLAGVLARAGDPEIRAARRWWWVTERGTDVRDGASSWNLSYVESFVFVRKG